MIDCLEFGRRWDDRLDARGMVPAPAPDPELEEHATGCAACRALGARLQLLERATLALGPPPAVPSGFADRVLLGLAGRPRPVVLPFLARRFKPLAAAAVLLLGGSLAWRAFRPDDRPAVVIVKPRPTETNAVLLADALADYTSATWKLASETSAPAARLGREVLQTAELAPNPRDFSLADGVRVRVDFDVIPSAESIQAVGARVNAGVRPLSGTARKAFGFLSMPSAPPKG